MIDGNKCHRRVPPAGTRPGRNEFFSHRLDVTTSFALSMRRWPNRAGAAVDSKGQVTQAVYIFTNMLRKLIQDEAGQKYIAAIFESKEKKLFVHETLRRLPKPTASRMPGRV